MLNYAHSDNSASLDDDAITKTFNNSTTIEKTNCLSVNNNLPIPPYNNIPVELFVKKTLIFPKYVFAEDTIPSDKFVLCWNRKILICHSCSCFVCLYSILQNPLKMYCVASNTQMSCLNNFLTKVIILQNLYTSWSIPDSGKSHLIDHFIIFSISRCSWFIFHNFDCHRLSHRYYYFSQVTAYGAVFTNMLA